MALRRREKNLAENATGGNIHAPVVKKHFGKTTRNVVDEIVEAQKHANNPVVVPISHLLDWEQKRGGKWAVSKTLNNAQVTVENRGYVCSFNEFQGKFLVECGDRGLVELDDELVVMIRREILEEYGFDPGKGNVQDAIEGMCLANRFNPVTEYFDELRWDGESRLDGWLSRYFGAPDTKLNRTIGRKVLCAIVRRGKRPGCKFDHAMVLEGDEGLGKSRAVEALVSGIGKEYYSDMGILAVSDKERQELTRGILVYELGELKGIRKAEAEDVKQFLVRVDDRGRRAYGKYVKTQLRTCVFIGTTNDQEYLVSQTGNRRWWPVECTGIDVDGLVEDIDQLLAEAVLAEPDEELFIPVELWPEAKALQDSRRYKHVWEELLVGLEETQHVKKMEGEAGPELRIHTATVLSQVLGIPASSVNDNTNKTLSSIMQRLGWKKSTKTIRIGKKSAMGYVKPIPLISAPSPAATAPLLPAPPFSGQRIRRL